MDEGTLKKEVRKKIETSEKISGYVAEEGESENRGQAPQGPQKKSPNFFKEYRKCVCVKPYVVSRCRRGDWYI